MSWVDNLNHAMAYIDHHLRDEIDLEEIGRIVVCPISTFQRFFMLATGITLTEYIRRRRLSCAVNDLKHTHEKVITIALRYGYETSDAFGVAFKRMYQVTPSQARKAKPQLKRYNRLHFTLSATNVKGDDEMTLLNVDRYRVIEPLFEGVRVILNHLGESYSPEYIQGVSGAGFKISGGCPSRPTCVFTRWPTDFIRYMGYEAIEYPTQDAEGQDMSLTMLDAIRRQIDGGRPALVWHAITSMEWDVVCGYDEEQKQLIGRGSIKGIDEYAREPWDRPAKCEIPFGAILIGEKRFTPDAEKLETEAFQEAIKHARRITDSAIPHEKVGLQFYRHWAQAYRSDTKERDLADAYCHDIYFSARNAVVGFLREIAPKYTEHKRDALLQAAACFAQEVDALKRTKPYLSWDSPWGINAARNQAVAPILEEAAEHYERGIEALERVVG